MNKIVLKKQVYFSILGGVVILLSLLVIIGWVFNIPTLTSILPVYPTMKFNTALSFAFAGAAIILIYHTDKKPAQYFYRAFSMAIFLMGALTLAEYIFDINLGIDNLFISDRLPVSVINAHPGRMAGGTALSFCFLGFAFSGMISPLRWMRLMAQYKLYVAGAMAYLALLGYILNVSPAQNFVPFISVALHTSIMMFAMTTALTFYNSDLGITGLFTGKGVGNEMVRQLFPVLMLVIIILGFVRVKLFAFHMVSIEFGVGLSATIFLAVLLLLMWRTALQLNRLEEARQLTEEANYKLNLDIAAAEKARRETEEINKRNLLFVQQAPSAIAMCDNNMLYMAVSQQWIKDYKLENTEVIGRLFYDVTPGLPAETMALHQHCLKGATSKSDGKYFVWPDGREQWIAWDIRPWYDAQGKIGGLLIYTFDVTGVKKREIQIQETTERLAEAQQIAHVGSWEWDINEGKMIWSDEQYRIYGFEPGQADPNSGLFYSMLHPDDKQRVIGALADALIGTKPYATDFRLVRADGSVCAVEARGRVLRNNAGQPVRFIGTLADISERKDAEEVRKNNAVLQSRNKEMEEFAYIASHDLQEPLRTVNSFIKLMNEEFGEQIPPDAQQYLQFISTSANRMRELIKGLLEFSRLGKQKTAEPVDCNMVIKELIEDLGEAINESKAIITTGQLPVINALPTEIKQLFQNLVSNAIKFRKPGVAPQIHISAKLLQNYYQFEVSDNGIGIDADHYQKIFILFQRLHKRDDYPGTGIGLSYCKKIVELHHGRIWVESVQNEGSRFFFTISNLQA